MTIPWRHVDDGPAVAAWLTFVLIAVAGCSTDSRPSDWGEFTNPDGGPETRDGRDGHDGYDIPPPPPHAGGEIIPDEPWEATHCNDLNWCWMHPSPFPHDIQKLRALDGTVRGVVRNALRNSPQPMTWDDDGPGLLPVPPGDGSDIADMTPTTDGWLAVDLDGRLRAYTPSGGWQVLDTLKEEEYATLEAASTEDFVAARRFGGGVTSRGGNQGSQRDLPGATLSLHMWPNGDVWALSETPGGSPQVPRYWTVLERPEDHFDSDDIMYAPPPTSDCSGPTLGYSRSAGLQQWPEPFSTPEPMPSLNNEEYPVVDLFCHRSGDVAAIFEGGIVLSLPIEDQDVFDHVYDGATVATTQGDTTYLGGYHGKMVEITDDEVRKIGEGTRAGKPTYTGLWVNNQENQAVLSHAEGATWGHEDGRTDISDTPLLVDNQMLGPETVDVWGGEKPRFAVTDELMFVFQEDGRTPWRIDTETDFGDADFVDMTGDGSGHAWLSTYDDIFRYDDDGWQAVAPDVRADFNFGTLHAAEDGNVYVTDGNDVRRLHLDGGDWNFDARYHPPCRDPAALHGTAGGDLWVGGANLCVARRTNGSWTTYETPSDLRIPSGTVVADHRVRQFVEQPGDRPPLAVTSAGILEPKDNQTLISQFLGESVDAAYLPHHNAVWVLTSQGVVGRYY